MKRIKTSAIFFIFSSFLAVSAAFSESDTSPVQSWENYEVLDRLLRIQEPCEPVVYDNVVIFTADSSLRRVGIAFAHEDFAPVYWFQKMMIPQEYLNPIILPGQKFPDPYKDSGIQFHVFTIPDHLKVLEYRLIINGLWTTDPINQRTRKDPISGLLLSVIHLPPRPQNQHPLNGLPEGLNFSFKGPPGEIVTVAGSFNGWDPFMYHLKEGPAGHYSLTLPLPSGTYQYLFFHRGQRFTDPHNPRRGYSRDGSAASEIVIP